MWLEVEEDSRGPCFCSSYRTLSENAVAYNGTNGWWPDRLTVVVFFLYWCRSLTVNIENQTSSCGAWQISGNPCRHAMRAIIQTSGQPQDYASNWFSLVFTENT